MTYYHLNRDAAQAAADELMRSDARVAHARPELERVGAEVEELGHDQWLVTHDDDRALPEIRRALDRISEVFG